MDYPLTESYGDDCIKITSPPPLAELAGIAGIVLELTDTEGAEDNHNLSAALQACELEDDEPEAAASPNLKKTEPINQTPKTLIMHSYSPANYFSPIWEAEEEIEHQMDEINAVAARSGDTGTIPQLFEKLVAETVSTTEDQKNPQLYMQPNLSPISDVEPDEAEEVEDNAKSDFFLDEPLVFNDDEQIPAETTNEPNNLNDVNEDIFENNECRIITSSPVKNSSLSSLTEIAEAETVLTGKAPNQFNHLKITSGPVCSRTKYYAKFD